jgi:hypothetical protein
MAKACCPAWAIGHTPDNMADPPGGLAAIAKAPWTALGGAASRNASSRR